MSLIDKVATEFVGFFGNRPVYRCLQNVSLTDANGQDYSFSSFALCIGDGDKFPMLFIKSAYRAVLHFAITHPSFDYSEWHDDPDCIDTPPDNLMRAVLAEDKTGHLAFINWSEQDRQNFEQLCRSEFLVHPYSDDNDLSIDDWLHVGIGELIFNAMPELVDLSTFNTVESLSESFSNGAIPLLYNNVWQAPDRAAHPFISQSPLRYQYLPQVWESEHLMGDLIAGNSWDFEELCAYLSQLESGLFDDQTKMSINVRIK